MKIGQLSIALELLKNNSLENVNNVIDMGTKSLRVKYSDLEYLFKQTNINFDKKKFFFEIKNLEKLNLNQIKHNFFFC